MYELDEFKQCLCKATDGERNMADQALYSWHNSNMLHCTHNAHYQESQFDNGRCGEENIWKWIILLDHAAFHYSPES